MHPILGNPRRLLLYLVGWIPLAVLICYLLAAPGALGWKDAAAVAAPLCALYAFMCLSAWYVCRGTPLEQSRFSRIILTLLLAAILNSAIWMLASRAIGDLLAFSPHFAGLGPRLAADGPMIFGAGILLYFLAVALHYVLLAAGESQEAKQREMRMGVLAREAELRALKAQVNPHFLFNSLNSISALTASDPARFLRVHRSYIVNLERVARIEPYAKDSHVAVLQSGVQIPVSRAGYARLRAFLDR